MAFCRSERRKVAAEHLAKRGIVVKRQRRAVRADEALSTADEVQQALSLRVAQRQVAVGHQHEAVEASQVLGREEREVELLGRLLVAFDGRHLEATRLSQLGHRHFCRPQTGVFVQTGVREKQQPFRCRRRRRLRGGERPCAKRCEHDRRQSCSHLEPSRRVFRPAALQVRIARGFEIANVRSAPKCVPLNGLPKL